MLSREDVPSRFEMDVRDEFPDRVEDPLRFDVLPRVDDPRFLVERLPLETFELFPVVFD